MIGSTLLRRATAQVAILALGMSMLAFVGTASAFTPTKSQAGSEATPLHLGSSTSSTSSGSGGASVVRTIVGLAIVIAVIWGLAWILRQVKSSREGGRNSQQAGTGLSSLTTLPLGSGRALHLVRAGSDYVLIASAEHSVVPIHHYSEQQAREAGLLNPDGSPAFAPDGATQQTGTLQIPSEQTDASLLDRVRDWTVRR